jgi:hypothetical protein
MNGMTLDLPLSIDETDFTTVNVYINDGKDMIKASGVPIYGSICCVGHQPIIPVDNLANIIKGFVKTILEEHPGFEWKEAVLSLENIPLQHNVGLPSLIAGFEDIEVVGQSTFSIKRKVKEGAV